MNRIFVNFIKVLVSLISLKYFQCKVCPSISTYNNPKFFSEGYEIKRFFKIPSTDLLLIITYQNATDYNIVYYNDISTIQSETINIVQPDYPIGEISYNYKQHKILVQNKERFIIANPYTLKSEGSISIPNLVYGQMIGETQFAIATLKQYEIYIIDTGPLVVVKTLNNKKFPNVLNTQNFYTKYFYSPSPSFEWIFITVNSYGFFSWSMNLDHLETRYNDYIGPTIVNNTDLANKQFIKHPSKDIFFVGGANLEILAFEIVDITTQTYRTLMKLNVIYSTNKYNVTNIIYKSSTKSSSKPLLIVGDTESNIYELVLEFDDVKKAITIPSYKNPPRYFDYYWRYLWYENPDETKNQIFISGTYYVIVFYYDDHTFKYILYFANDFKSKRFIYEGNGQYYYALLRKQTVNYYNITYLGSEISKVNFTYNAFNEESNFYRVKNCEECLIIKNTLNSPQYHFMTYISMYPRVNNNNQSLNISSLGYKWNDVNLNLDPFYYKNQIWVVFGFRNKTVNKKFLFALINMQDKTQNVNLTASTDEENSRQSSYAILSVDDPENLEIIGIDTLGYIYVWNFLSPKIIKYSRKSNQSCLNSEIGTVYQYNKNKWLIFVCDDMKVLSYDFQLNITSVIRNVASIPMSLRAFPSSGIIVIGDTALGNAYIYKFNDGIFTYFLTIYPGTFKEIVIYVELLKDKTIWVQYEQSNLFFSLSDCIENVKDCLSCSQSYIFKMLNSNTIGDGTQTNPYTNTHKFLTGMLKSQRYQSRISEVTSINVNIVIDPQSQKYMILPQEYLNIYFSSVISLTIKSKIENQLALIDYANKLEFSNFNQVCLQDIKIQYSFDKQPNECGIKFYNITQNATLNNVYLINIKSQDIPMSCFQVSAEQANLQILKIQIQNEDFSNHQSIFSTLYSQWIDIQNLSLDNCILGDSFSIVKQNSNLIATIKSVSITNNTCTQKRTNEVSSLFSAGLFNVQNLQIQNNSFCNKIIFSSVPLLEHQNYQFQFKQVQILDNSFIAKTSYLFFNSLYSERQNPSHYATFLQMTIQNNSLQKTNEYDLMEASLIQTSKIMNHVFKDITFKNHHEISFSSIEYSDNVQVIGYYCINDKEYFDSSPDSTSGSCLQLYKVLSTEIKTIRINYKKAYNNKLINLLNKLYNKLSDFNISDGEFSYMILIQNTINSFANPITIQSENILMLTFSNCHFFDNSLEVVKDSYTFSTSAIWIENSLGTVKITDSTFKNSTSNSIYNFVFIQTSLLQLQSITFDSSSFALDTTQQMGGFMNLKIKTLKIVDTSFSKSKSQYGSFIYIESFGSFLNIDITNTTFREGYAEIDGGALYIDIGKSKLQFICTNCGFDGIYTYSQRSSVIGFSKYRIKTQNLIHETKYQDGHIQNIFGVGDNFFTDVQNMKLSFIDIKQIRHLTSQEFDTSINQQFGKIAAQQSTLVGSEYSEINIKGCSINDLSILNQDSNLPLLINAEFTSVSFTDTTILDGIFVRSAIQVTNGKLSIKNTQFKNVIQQKKLLSRQLQAQEGSTINDIFSLIVMKDSDLIVSEGSSFNGTKCYNNCTGAVFYLMNTSFEMSHMNISNSQAEFGGSVFIQGLKLFNKIVSSKFENNIAQVDGGAIYLQALKEDKFLFNIENCEILSNYAVSGKGGGLFIRSLSQNSTSQFIEIQDTKLIGNIAQIGGGIYQKEISPKISGSTIFKQNVGQTFGNDSLSYPTHLRLSSMNEFLSTFKAEKVQKDIIVISNFRSGDKLTNLFFELVNDQDEIIKPLTSQELQDFAVKVHISKNENFQKYSIRGNVSAPYDSKTSKLFVFQNFDFIGIPGSQATLEFISDQIYVLDQNKTNQYNQDYSFKLVINFRDCIKGEAISVYNYLTECIICQEGKYSFDLQSCNICPMGATCAGGAQIIANQGYWRKTNESTDLMRCSLLENCQGGSFGNHICYEGHIGALCEECDISGEYWKNSYSKTAKNSCTNCDEIAHNTWLVLMVTLWTLISMALAIRGDIQAKLEQGVYHAFNLRKQIRQKTNSVVNAQSIISQQIDEESVKNLTVKNQQQRKSINSSTYSNGASKNLARTRNTSIFYDKIKSQKSAPIRKSLRKYSLEEDKSGIYIKILTNYFQIVSSIATFNLSIPSGIFELSNSVGQPLKKTMSSLDCFLKDYETSIPYIYRRLIFSLLIPVGYFIIFLSSIGIIWIAKRKGRFPWYILSTTIMFLIIYIQPDLVAQMIAIMSCRQIGDTKYILANVSYECYTTEHLNYVLFLVGPLLAIWIFVLPLILFLMLHKNRSNLNKIQIKLKYGFLYKEYNREAFYWEFIKMVEKICIILSLNFFSTEIIIKALLVYMIIMLYGILSIIIEPYENQSINSLDRQSTIVCALSVLLGLFIYQNPYQFLSLSSLGIIIILNSLFIISIFKKIVNAYLKKLEAILAPYLRKLALKFPKFSIYLKQKEDGKKVSPIVKEKVKKIFENYLCLSAEEKQNIKIRILTTQFNLTLSNIFGNYNSTTIGDDRNQNLMQYTKKFNLFNSYEEQKNLLYQNQNLSPLLRPIYSLEDNVNDKENQKRIDNTKHSVLTEYKFEDIITNIPLDSEQYEVHNEEFNGGQSSNINYIFKEMKFLNSLNNQTTNEDSDQVQGVYDKYLSQQQNLFPLNFLHTYSEQVNTNGEDRDLQQKRKIDRFFELDYYNQENEITPKPDDQEQQNIHTYASQIYLKDQLNNKSKETNFLNSLNNQLMNLDVIQDKSKNEESQTSENNGKNDKQHIDEAKVEEQNKNPFTPEK